MPEFIRSPALPNALANSLVQLAAQQSSGLARGISDAGAAIGHGLASKGDHDRREAEKEKEREDREKERQHELAMQEHQTLRSLVQAGKATPMPSSAPFIKPLEGGDLPLLGKAGMNPPQMNFGLTSATASQMLDNARPATDYPGLLPTLGDKYAISNETAMKNPGLYTKVTPEMAAGNPGLKDMEGKYILNTSLFSQESRTARDAAKSITVGDEHVKKFPALEAIKGKTITTAQWVNLNNAQQRVKMLFEGVADKDLDRALRLASHDADFLDASLSGDDDKLQGVVSRKLDIIKKVGAGEGVTPKQKQNLDDIVAEGLLSSAKKKK
jgi:hypothetical protein